MNRQLDLLTGELAAGTREHFDRDEHPTIGVAGMQKRENVLLEEPSQLGDLVVLVGDLMEAHAASLSGTPGLPLLEDHGEHLLIESRWQDGMDSASGLLEGIEMLIGVAEGLGEQLCEMRRSGPYLSTAPSSNPVRQFDREVHVTMDSAEVARQEFEWHTAKSLLTMQLELIRAGRINFDSRLREVIEGQLGGTCSPSAIDLWTKLDEAVAVGEHLKTELAHAEKIVDELRNEITDQTLQEPFDTCLRDELSRLAQERAALSRNLAELARRLDQENRLSMQPARKQADERYLSLRRTWKMDRHDPSEPPSISIVVREFILDIWNRLQGPTDTD